MSRQPLAYYLIRPEKSARGGPVKAPVCTVLTEEDEEAIVLFTDGEAAVQFRDDWAEQLGWEVGYMDDGDFVAWLRQQAAEAMRYVLVDPVCESPDQIEGELIDISTAIEEFAARATAAQPPRPAKPPRGKPRGRRGK